MVSAKFHVVGEKSDWFRVRLQEEIYAHGLEGDVLAAGMNTLVVIVDGDKSVIKRMHSDVREMCPAGVQCTEVIFSIQHPARAFRFKQQAGVPIGDNLVEVLAEMERKLTRIDQNVAKILALLDGGARPAQKEENAAEPKMDVTDDATSGFASMFGN